MIEQICFMNGMYLNSVKSGVFSVICTIAELYDYFIFNITEA